MHLIQTIIYRVSWLVLFSMGLNACASKPQIFPDTTPLIVVALEAGSFAETVKAAQQHRMSMRTGIGVSVSFGHLAPGVACKVLGGPDGDNGRPSGSGSQEVSSNNSEAYRRAYEGVGFTSKFKSDGVLDYWGNRTFRNGKPEMPGYIFAVSEAFHEGEDAYQLSRIHVSGYALGAFTSSGGRYWDFELPAIRPAITFGTASIIFIGPIRLVVGENDTMNFEWSDLEPQPFVEALAKASGRSIDSIVSAKQYIIDSSDCI